MVDPVKPMIPTSHWCLSENAPLGSKSVWVKCPGCNRKAQLDHEVDASGNVAPSLDCTNPDCSYHEFVRLEGWPGGGELQLLG